MPAPGYTVIDINNNDTMPTTAKPSAIKTIGTDILYLLRYTAATLPFIIIISLARGWNAAAETNVSLDKLHGRGGEVPFLSPAAFLMVKILLQIVGVFTKGALTFEGALKEANRDPIEENDESTPLIAPATPAKPRFKALRYSLFFLLAGLAASLEGPFTYQKGQQNLGEHIPDANDAATALFNTFFGVLSATVVTAYLFTEGRETYHELCTPEQQEAKNLGIAKRTALTITQIGIFLVHFLYFLFKGSYAYNLPASEDGCPSFSTNIALSSYIGIASAALALSVMVFEGNKITDEFSPGLLAFWRGRTRKEQAIMFFSILMTLGGAIVHALPSTAENEELLRCLFGDTLSSLAINLISGGVIVFEAVLDVMVELAAVIAAMKIVTQPSLIRPLTLASPFHCLWGRERRVAEVMVTEPDPEPANARVIIRGAIHVAT